MKVALAGWLAALALSALDSSAVPTAPAQTMFALPPANIENTVPPVLGHRYFEIAAARPFPVGGGDFSLTRAWWLAEAALLAYAEPPFAPARFRAAGFTVDEDQPANHGSTQAYVVYTDTVVIVAFRGTELPKAGIGKSLDRMFGDSIRDITADAQIIPRAAKPQGSAHGGFVRAWTSIATKVLSRVRELKAQRPSRTVCFTGHSLGAALAVLVAAEYGAADGLYTFGSPPVGDAEFTAGIRCPAFRFVNNNDAVPNVPLTYHHVGTLQYFGRDGELGTLPPVAGRVVGGEADAVTTALTNPFAGNGLVFPRTPLTDHAPLYYALLVRHAMEAAVRP